MNKKKIIGLVLTGVLLTSGSSALAFAKTNNSTTQNKVSNHVLLTHKSENPLTATEVVTIMNGMTNQPLANTRVDISGSSLITNSQGQVTMTGLNSGDQVFHVTAGNYLANTALKFKSIVGETGHTTITMAANSANLNLTVKNAETGKIMANSNVDVNGMTLTTNANGQITGLPFWAFNKTLSVSANKFATTIVNIDAKAGENINKTVTIAPKHTILNLTFKNMETNKIMANTKVTFNGAHFTTNSKGQIEGMKLWATPQSIKLESNGFESTTINIDAKAGETINQTVMLAPKHTILNLTFKNAETGKIMANTKVTFNGAHFTTNSKGQIEGMKLWAAPQSIKLESNGFENKTINIDAKAGETINQTVMLAPKHTILNLTFKNAETGKIMANTKVTFNGAHFTTNSKGQIEGMKLWAAPQSIKLESNGFENKTININAKAGETINQAVMLTPSTVTTKLNKISESQSSNLNLTFINMSTGQIMANTQINVNGSIFTTNSKGQLPTIPVDAINQIIKLGSYGFENVDIKLDTTVGETINRSIKLAPNPSSQVITVMSGITNEPIANSNVTIDGSVFKTNSNGQVTLSNLWAGPQEFTIGADGSVLNSSQYLMSKKISFNTEVGETGHSTVTLAPNSTKVNLTFVNMSTGNVMANTKVNFEGSTFITNSKGQIETLKLWATSQSIKIGSNGFESTSINLDGKGGETINQTVKLAPIASRQVITVLNKTNKKPLTNTDVNIGGIMLKTNFKGEVLMNNLWAGNHEFTLKAKNFESASFSFTTVKGETGHSVVLVTPSI